ncbi:hypothetical protein C7212DRAFT_348520 [Tuber magnatum]|uniref:Uncharacterized protein n=1 Tax=Tuber magnatum TaxID=42249 RepID=A0A317SCI6_9PEZI|nr:hypothetical protein C7212DRAFT_348520 [Tuber magnatum]
MPERYMVRVRQASKISHVLGYAGTTRNEQQYDGIILQNPFQRHGEKGREKASEQASKTRRANSKIGKKEKEKQKEASSKTYRAQKLPDLRDDALSRGDDCSLSSPPCRSRRHNMASERLRGGRREPFLWRGERASSSVKRHLSGLYNVLATASTVPYVVIEAQRRIKVSGSRGFPVGGIWSTSLPPRARLLGECRVTGSASSTLGSGIMQSRRGLYPPTPAETVIGCPVDTGRRENPWSRMSWNSGTGTRVEWACDLWTGRPCSMDRSPRRFSYDTDIHFGSHFLHPEDAGKGQE